MPLEDHVSVERTIPIAKETLPKVASQAFAIAPNPTHSNATIYYELSAPSSVSIDLYDLTGQKTKHILKHSTAKAASYEQSIDLSGLTKGVYWVVLNTTFGITTRKLIRH